MIQALVSVIVPCYNHGEYLEEALNSVLSQTYTNWECIIINDGSTDDSETIAKDFCEKDSRFIYFFQNNSGVSVARNYGISKSSGTYILPLDGDDKLGVNFIEDSIAVLSVDDSLKLVYPNVELFGAYNKLWDLPSYCYEELLFKNMIVCSGMFRKSDFDKTTGYNINMKDGYEDWDFWISFLKPTDKVIRLDYCFLYYRIKQNSRNEIAEPIKRKLFRTIYSNNKEKYKLFLEGFNQDVIYYKQCENQLLANIQCVKTLEQQLSNIRNSKAYRLGMFLLKPFRLLK